MDVGPPGVYQLFRRGGQQLVHMGAGTVKSLGGHVPNGPMEVPVGGWIVQIMDPQGRCSRCTTRRRASSRTAGAPGR
jgi:hypothetical protein